MKNELYKDPTASADARAKDLLARMSIDEKIDQLRSEMIHRPGIEPRDYSVGHVRAIAHFMHTGGKSASAAECAEAMNEDQIQSIKKSPHSIPAMINCEALHGANWGYTTVFPQAVGLAATWDPEMMRDVVGAIAKELRAVGVRQVFSPVVNLARDPRWGRAQETYGEDPYLASEMAVAYISRMQGAGVVSTPKHFAANVADGGRDSNYITQSWRTLRETELPAFKAAFQKGGAMSVMPAYNAIEGVPCSCNSTLLTDILRDEWGFGGFAVSDYGAVSICAKMGIAADVKEAAGMCLAAGLEVELPTGGNRLRELLDEGAITEEMIDRAVLRVLRVKFAIGLFEQPLVDVQSADSIVRADEHLGISLAAARKSMTLLKNNGNVLPIIPVANGTKIGVFGPAKADIQLGDYTGPYGGWPGEGVNPLKGMLELAPEGIEIISGGDNDDLSIMADCDVAIYFATIFETEGGDRSNLDLPGEEAKIAGMVDECDHEPKNIKTVTASANTDNNNAGNIVVNGWGKIMAVTDQEGAIKALAATGKPVVVVLMTGSAVCMEKWIDRVPTVLQAWYPGELGGYAIADTIFGKVNPGGKLPVTFPKRVGQLPLYYDYKPSGRGYGYNDGDGKPQFAFGHGLSYTVFGYEKLNITVGGEASAYITAVEDPVLATVSFDVTNTGCKTGDEIAQVYLRDVVSTVLTPLKKLVGFSRLNEMAPGETRRVNIPLTYAQLALWNRDMEFVVEPGVFDVMVGAASDDIRLEGTFEIVKPGWLIDSRSYYR